MEAMSAPQLYGPYALMSANIELAITERARAAVYGLGRIAANGKFNALYVGRSDENLAAELRRFIGQYGAFVYGYRSSPLDAFRAECELYHLLEPEDNTGHPQRPEGTAWACALCRALG
jgi:hypothetical protein